MVETAEAETECLAGSFQKVRGVRNRDAVGRIIGHSDASSRRGMGNSQGRDVTEDIIL
jgi:hypothetical protein